MNWIKSNNVWIKFNSIDDVANSIIFGNNFDVFKKFPKNSVDLIISDPPYGINFRSMYNRYDNLNRVYKPIFRDGYRFNYMKNDFEVPLSWLVEAFRILKNDMAIYIFCHWKKFSKLMSKVEDVGFKLKNLIVMNKSNWGMGDLTGSYAPKYELVLYAVKGKHKLNFYDGREKDVISVPYFFSGGKRYHPAQKGLSWVTKFILNSSKRGDIVLDPFCGSGSFLMEFYRLGRKYIGIEIDEKYCRISQLRLLNFKLKNIR